MVARLLVPLSGTRVSLSRKTSKNANELQGCRSVGRVLSWHVLNPGSIPKASQATCGHCWDPSILEESAGGLEIQDRLWLYSESRDSLHYMELYLKKKTVFQDSKFEGLQRSHWLRTPTAHAEGLLVSIPCTYLRFTCTYSPMPGNLMPSSSNCGHCMHMVHMYTVKQNTPMHKVKKNLKIKCFEKKTNSRATCFLCLLCCEQGCQSLDLNSKKAVSALAYAFL